MNIGVHCVLFKERIASETNQILSELGLAGFAGVEIGARFFGLDEKAKFTGALNNCGIVLSGLHVGTSFTELEENEDAVTERVVKAASFLQDMPNRNILFSCMNPKEFNIDEAVRVMSKLVLQCAEKGVALHYHNHAHEFENDMEIFRQLLEKVPTLLFCLDLGWILKAGRDPIAIVEQHSTRIKYVHLRDWCPHDGFVALGKGLMDYTKLLPTLKNYLGADDWAVVEYEDGAQDTGRYKKAIDYLNGLGC